MHLVSLYLLHDAEGERRGIVREGGADEDCVSSISECDKCGREAKCQQLVDVSTQMPQHADGSELLEPSHAT